MMAFCVLTLIVNLSIILTFQGEEPDVMCGYRLYFTNVTWYTAYNICEEEKKMLVQLDSDLHTFEAIFSHLITKLFERATTLINGSNLGIWLGTFQRTSSNEIMDYHCKPLYMDPFLGQLQPREDILCIFYNFFTGKFQAENCDKQKSFLCKSYKDEKTDCMMTSNRSLIYNDGNHVLCFSSESNTQSTYFAAFQNETFFATYRYKPRENCSLEKFYPGIPEINHTSTFWYLPHPPLYKPDKPLNKWCPELQERIEIRKNNLTVHRKNTTKYQRTLISAPDDRPTSKYMGVVGALVISLVAGLIVCVDLMNFSKKCKPVRVKAE
ncbi:uncharacterized protein [Magallana gigas]|uniref:uncharacterized protein n=1 Tax=Magallana gigas TaxID=29159 RepID=UPI00333F49F1